MALSPSALPLDAVRALAKSGRITQKSIGQAVGLSQSQVSRVLSGSTVRPGKNMHVICAYVVSSSHGSTVARVRENRELLEAMAFVWDGTPRHATALAVVIRSLRVLGDAADQHGGIDGEPVRPVARRAPKDSSR